jgi:hypothetical protein
VRPARLRPFHAGMATDPRPMRLMDTAYASL